MHPRVMAIKGYIPQSSRAEGLQSDGLMPDPGHSLRGGLSSLQRCIQCILQLDSAGHLYRRTVVIESNRYLVESKDV